MNPSTVQPWDMNWGQELFNWGFAIGLILLIWFATMALRYRKNPANILGRNVEDFAGQVQEGNGPIPVFLILTYMTVFTMVIIYGVIYFFTGYNY